MALIGAGAFPLLIMGNDSEPATSIFPTFDGTDLILGLVGVSVASGGVLLVISGLTPRPGWDPVPNEGVPTLLRSPGPTVGLGFRIEVGR